MANQMTPNFIKPISHRIGFMVTGGISATLLISALMFQYVGEFLPCNLCIWQRWPHLVVIVLAFAGLRGFVPRGMLWLIVIAGIVSVSLGAYHAGVEYGFGMGPLAAPPSWPSRQRKSLNPATASCAASSL